MGKPSAIPATSESTPFWERKTLEEMTPQEWESLCDKCGRCCLMKYSQPDDDNDIFYTDVGCALLDCKSGQCSDYAGRTKAYPDCVALTPNTVRERWLPPTCAYRLVDEYRRLYWWHPLISGDSETVKIAGISVVGRCKKTEADFADQNKIEERRREWPLRFPPGTKR